MNNSTNFPVLLYPSFSFLLMAIEQNPSNWKDGPNCIYAFSCMREEEAIDRTFKNYYPSASPAERASILAVLDEAVQQGRCRWKQAPGEEIAIQWIVEALRGLGVEGLPVDGETAVEEQDWQARYGLPSLRDFLYSYASRKQLKFMWGI